MRTRSLATNYSGIAAKAIMLVVLALAAQAGTGQTVSFAPVCAARDLEAVTLIEQRGQGEEMASERVANAAFTMLLAREVCAERRVEEALALYDSIIGALHPMVSQRPR
jgi:hypothetical protein